MTEFDEEHERKPDQLDIANDLAMRSSDYAVRQIRSKAHQVRKSNKKGTFDDIWCEDCGDEIELARMLVAFNNHLCVFCANKRERTQKMKGST